MDGVCSIQRYPTCLSNILGVLSEGDGRNWTGRRGMHNLLDVNRGVPPKRAGHKRTGCKCITLILPRVR